MWFSSPPAASNWSVRCGWRARHAHPARSSLRVVSPNAGSTARSAAASELAVGLGDRRSRTVGDEAADLLEAGPALRRTVLDHRERRQDHRLSGIAAPLQAGVQIQALAFLERADLLVLGQRHDAVVDGLVDGRDVGRAVAALDGAVGRNV